MDQQTLAQMEADAIELQEQAKKDAAFAKKVLDVVAQYKERQKAEKGTPETDPKA